MSDGVIFLMGVVITLIVLLGYGMLIWAAIEDGKAQKRTDELLQAREESEG